MKKLKVLVLVHEDLVPPVTLEGLPDEDVARFKMEYDVVAALEALGHEVSVLGVFDELRVIRKTIEERGIDVVFNLLEEFHGQALYDQHVASYLELLRVPYTGCNPRGLVLARDKGLSKKVVSYHRVPVPRFSVFRKGRKVRRPRRLEFPLIVKSLIEESSTGIAQASVVRDDEALAERVRLVHERVGTDAIAEQFIDGRELYVGVIGNQRLQVLPTWELILAGLPDDVPRIATSRVKHDAGYQDRHGIEAGRAADLAPELQGRMARLARRIYRTLDLSGYARLDFRLRSDGSVFFLEANPNPDISSDEELAASAEAAGMTYEQLVQRILSLGVRAGRGVSP